MFQQHMCHRVRPPLGAHNERRKDNSVFNGDTDAKRAAGEDINRRNRSGGEIEPFDPLCDASRRASALRVLLADLKAKHASVRRIGKGVER